MTKVSNHTLAEFNRDQVYRILKESGTPMTIRGIWEVIFEEARVAKRSPIMNDRTIRRSINWMIERGLIRKYGKDSNADMYTLNDGMASDARFADGELPMVPLGGSLVSVRDFIVVMTNPDANPLRRDQDTTFATRMSSDTIRKAMTAAIMFADELGFESQLDEIRQMLIKYEQESAHAHRVIKSFLDSAIWFDMYRDKVARELSAVRRENPDLIQLAYDYVL